MRRRTLLFTAISTFLATVASMPLVAQESDEEENYRLEEVVVTAQKRVESIQEVPISISVYSGDFLEDTGVKTLEDVARLAPNFYISNSSQQTNNRIVIRGVGSVGNSGIEPSVGVFIDGVYYPRPGSVIGTMLDVESVEVLRGPQGTLFGRNTPMGALNITTRNPTDEKNASFELGYGNYNALELGAMVSGPLGETVSGRFAIKYADRDGYGHNTFDGKDFGARDDLVMRGKLNFDFSDNLSLLLTVDYAEINSEGTAIEVLNSTSNPVFNGTLNALFGQNAETDDPYDWKINQDHRDTLNDEQYGFSADLNYDFANGIRLRSITAVRNWEAAVFESAIRITTDIAPRITDYETDTFSQEFQLISAGGETIDWVAGLFYYDESYDIVQAFNAGDSYCIPVVFAILGATAAGQCLQFPQDRFTESFFEQDLESFAAYGQATWNISESWAITLGGRWTDDQKDGDFIQAITNPFAALVRAPEEVLGMQRDDTKFTYFTNASWFVTDETMLFATYSTGYKSGGFNSEGGGVPLGQKRIFGPEETTNYELGIKSTLLEGTMTANVTAYRTDLDDFQDRLFDGLSFVVVNAGKLRQQGIEADINWMPMRQLRLMAGISYLDSEYLSFANAPGLPGGPSQDLKGERKTYSPEWQTSLAGDWTGTLSESMQWFVGAGWQFVDDQNIGANSSNNPQSVQKSYSLFNGRVGISANSGKWDLTLYGNNLTDEGYCITIYDQPLGGALGALDPVNNTMVQRCVVGAPRTYNLKLRWWY
ncbi:MAG: TonB-dependent receptor [Proteobacteria bacterium]|nr:TonB-dependent receptor [Pseudomonadota bacterium]